ncbi:hypothetical protein ACTQ54_07440 [Fundicoccus sp. Sow4_H7]|uniref:hypothetical protein n=1 Tax=Fundicoccus sp. Sow4_H7 TaxID=3438784 RepID=UPI003F930F28
MSRKLERIIIYIASIWQIITGAITAGIYLFNLESTFLGANSALSTFGNFVFIYGMAYVTIGIINAIFANKYLEDGSILKVMLYFWIGQIVVFLLLVDYVSLMLLILATTIAFAKNKSIKMQHSIK